MRRLLISTFVTLASMIPAAAQDAPQSQPVTPNATQEQSDPLKDATQKIQQLIQEQLASAGFTEIQMVPNSYVISAKDRDGNAVVMMASPRPDTEFGNSSPGQDDGSNPSSTDQPYTTGQGPNTEI
jgi:hypothetical protein